MPEFFFKPSWKLLLPFVVDPEPFMGTGFDAGLKKIEDLFHLRFHIALIIDRVAVMDDLFSFFPADGGDDDRTAGSFREKGGKGRGPCVSS
jgi:hypothetical protein